MFDETQEPQEPQRDHFRETSALYAGLTPEAKARFMLELTDVLRPLFSHCEFSGCTSARALELRHVIPVERGGQTEPDNLFVLCPKHCRLMDDAHVWMAGNVEVSVVRDAEWFTATALDVSRRTVDGRTDPDGGPL